MNVIGIDPGLTGAVALLAEPMTAGWPSPGSYKCAALWDTPTAKVSNKNVYLPGEMSRLILRLVETEGNNVTMAVLEKVHTMPQQGAVSGGKLMYGFGLWEGILAALAVPYNLVPPQTWKKAMMHGMGKDKGASIVRAHQLFPDMIGQLQLKKHHGRADALLIAEYGVRFLNAASSS